jgi:hypothetical protein
MPLAQARLSFARALYRRHGDTCTTFLFDDPLASVDGAVAQQMFQLGLIDFLKGYTRVVVMSSTAHVELRNVTSFLRVAGGSIVQEMVQSPTSETSADRETVSSPALQHVAADAGNGAPCREASNCSIFTCANSKDFSGITSANASAVTDADISSTPVDPLVLPEKRDVGQVSSASVDRFLPFSLTLELHLCVFGNMGEFHFCIFILFGGASSIKRRLFG